MCDFQQIARNVCYYEACDQVNEDEVQFIYKLRGNILPHITNVF